MIGFVCRFFLMEIMNNLMGYLIKRGEIIPNL